MAVKSDSNINDGPEALGFYLSRAQIVFRSLLKNALVESGLDSFIKPGMGNLLFALYEHDGQTKTELASCLLLSKMTITRLVRQVESHGLVITVRDERDGRANRVNLTPLAKSLETKYRRVGRNLEARIASQFTPRQLNQFRGYLKTLLMTLEDETSNSLC
ncbi:MAG: MarR family transcriptional regulator [Verrucomicrobia bacterium]|nr:MarR family transcriptional regulator [Verrucomicrobiota bacterium]